MLSPDIIQQMGLQAIVDCREDVKFHLDDDKATLEALNSELIRRAAEKRATILFTNEAQIEISRTTKIQHRIDVLRRLKGKIPDELFDKAVYLKTIEPQWVADTVKLKSISKKFGADVSDIISEGMPYEEVGSPKITITPRTLTVRESAEAIAA